jgi:hypothetical protein
MLSQDAQRISLRFAGSLAIANVGLVHRPCVFPKHSQQKILRPPPGVLTPVLKYWDGS